MNSLVPFVMLIGHVAALIESISSGCSAADIALITAGLADVITVVTDVRNQLLTYNALTPPTDDPRSAIYTPLLRAEDLPTFVGYLEKIRDIKTAGYKVRLYCDSSTPHIVWVKDPKTEQSFWVDTDFYHNPKPNEKRMIVVGREPGVKPPGSWTKHGYRVNDNFDSSNQAHVQLGTAIIRGLRASTDNRDLVTIRRDGLGAGQNFNVLDYIRPLTRTLIHELFHVVGGLDAENRPVVIDVKNPNANRNYGSFKDCVSQKNAEVPAVRQGECLTMVVVGLYLDNIKGNPAFWSLGVIDRTTLKPIGVPAGQSSTKIKIKHRALRIDSGWEVGQ